MFEVTIEETFSAGHALRNYHGKCENVHGHNYRCQVTVEGEQAEVVSALQVFRTTLDGGATELFAVGRLHDTIKLHGGAPRLAKRIVKLDTRLMGYGYHIPF